MPFKVLCLDWCRLVSVLFTARYSTVQSAVLLSLLVVCLSVCDVGGSWPHRLKILETNCANNWLNIFALRSPEVIHLLPGNMEKFWGRLEVGWKKVACWSTKTAITVKRVKIEEKLLWRVYRKSPTLFRFLGRRHISTSGFASTATPPRRPFLLYFAHTAQQSVLYRPKISDTPTDKLV